MGEDTCSMGSRSSLMGHGSPDCLMNEIIFFPNSTFLVQFCNTLNQNIKKKNTFSVLLEGNMYVLLCMKQKQKKAFPSSLVTATQCLTCNSNLYFPAESLNIRYGILDEALILATVCYTKVTACQGTIVTKPSITKI